MNLGGHGTKVALEALIAMKTGLCIQTVLGQAKPLHRRTSHQVLRHNRGGVFRLHIAVPDGLRVNHHHRTMLALVQTTGLVDAHFSGQPRFFGQLLQLRMQIALAIRGSGGAGSSGGS